MNRRGRHAGAGTTATTSPSSAGHKSSNSRRGAGRPTVVVAFFLVLVVVVLLPFGGLLLPSLRSGLPSPPPPVPPELELAVYEKKQRLHSSERTRPVNNDVGGVGGAAGDDADDDLLQLPQWMKEYFAWHARQRKRFHLHDSDNNNNSSGGTEPAIPMPMKFLILRCLRMDRRPCGGLSDRLKALPLLVKLAADTGRVFLIRWDKPCALEEFLVPPSSTTTTKGGNGGSRRLVLDWRVPDWLALRLARGEGLFLRTADQIFEAVKTNESLVSVKLQDQHGGSQYYDQLVGGSSAVDGRADGDGDGPHRQVYGPLFRAMFVPSQPLAVVLEEERRRYPALSEPGSYAAAHLRALYVPPLPPAMVPSVAVNAVNCASQLRPSSGGGDSGGVPIFFASDSKIAVQAVREYALEKKTQSRPIVTIDRDRGTDDPLHLDKATSRDPRDYYDAFLDLFFFANARCISHGQGGFGRLGVLLSRNASCLFPFVAQSRLVECQWKD